MSDLTEVEKTRVCIRCGERRPIDDFYKDKRSLNGRIRRCSRCHRAHQDSWKKANAPSVAAANRAWRIRNREASHRKYRRRWLRKNYGITVEQYEEMLSAQDGRCAICGSMETSSERGKLRRLSVDHDHRTGKVRHLLCNRCNRVLGFIKEDRDLLRKVDSYLASFL